MHILLTNVHLDCSGGGVCVCVCGGGGGGGGGGYLKKKTIYQFREYFCCKNKVDTNPRLPPSHSNVTWCRLWSTGSDSSQSML